MRQTIIELELALLTPEVRTSVSALQQLIHDEFVEIGTTGVSFGKAEVLLHLPQQKAPTFNIFDINYRLLSHDLAQLTYRASFKPVNELGKRYSLRTSLWKFEGERWQMIYHQGTPCEAFF